MNVGRIDLLQWVIIALGLGMAAIIYIRRIKTHGRPQYAPATPRQKAVCLILLAAMLGTWAIYYAGNHPFSGYEKQVAVIATMVGCLYVTRLTAILERH
jgi:hypothetical protein